MKPIQSVLMAVVLILSVHYTHSQKVLEGTWSGNIEIPGSPLEVILHVTEGKAVMDIPAQGTKAMAVKPFAFDTKKNTLKFGLPDVPGNASYSGTFAGDSISGTFEQAGYRFPLTFRKDSGKKAQAEKERIETFVRKADQLADTMFRVFNTPGLSLVVVNREGVLLSKGYGFADLAEKKPVTPQTMFAIGSCTKAFTAMVIAMQVEKGSISWNTRVKDILPGFGMNDPLTEAQITVEDLLCHRSGVPRHDLAWYGNMPKKENLLTIVKNLEPNAGLREKWQYQNFMYAVAGLVSEQLLQKPWEQQISELLFTPLGMNHSGTDITLLSNNNGSVGYVKKSGKTEIIPHRDISVMGPAGSINSNAEDMGRWCTMLLNSGKIGDKEIIPAAVVRDVFAPRMVMQANRSKNMSHLLYSLGWLTANYKGHHFIQHGGNIDGYSALTMLLPDDNMALCIMVNENASELTNYLAMFLTDLWLDLPLTDISSILPSSDNQPEISKQKSSIEGTKPMHSAPKYVGSYAHASYGKIVVSEDKGKLLVTFGQFNLAMEHWHYETFRAVMTDDGENSFLLTFQTGESGFVESVSTVMDPSVSAIVFKKEADKLLETESYLREFEGEYTFDKALKGEIKLENGKLWATVTGQGKILLIPWQKDLFKLAELEGYTFAFARDKKGKIVELISKQPNGDFKAKKTN